MESVLRRKRHFLVYIVNLARALGNLTAGLHTGSQVMKTQNVISEEKQIRTARFIMVC